MNIINLKIEKEDIYYAIQKARGSIFLDNLRDRTPFVRFDSKIRGYLGEISITKWLNKNGINIKEINTRYEKGDLDIDLLVSNKIIEIKTSLIPDVWGTLENTINRADIKIIKRGESVIEDTHGDVHIQIYFNFLTKKRDFFLESINGIPDHYADDDLIEKMELNKYEVFFVAWIDKKSLSSYISNLNGKAFWTYGMRDFWKCPINILGKNPEDLIKYLQQF